MQRAVIVTGASTGIGLASAEALAQRGWRVFACARKAQDLQRLGQLSKQITPVELDVTNPEQIQAAVKTLEPQFANFQEISLVNNAGIAASGPLEALAAKNLRGQFDVNFFGLMEVTQAFLPWIRKTKGRIINMSSVSGQFAMPYLGAYAASKFALEAASDALRRELLSYGVKVVLIEPGVIDTPIWNKNLNERERVWAGFLPERIKVYEKSYEKFADVVGKTTSRAMPVSRVSAAVVKALEHPNPPVRIPVISVADWFQRRFVRWLPEKLVDRMISKMIQIKE